MKKTPKSLRLQLGLFGRTNTGKSSFLNMVAGQDVAITSETPGTTTDVVEKSMELLPVGPVVFLDTAGIDDASELGKKRIARSKKILDRADIYILIAEANIWNEYEKALMEEAKKRNTPVIIIINKVDVEKPKQEFLERIEKITSYIILCSSIDTKNRDNYVNPLKEHIISVCPDDYINPPAIIGDLIPAKGIAVLIVPIDKEAPKGRIILPQVQTIRDALDNNQASVVIKESEYPQILNKFSKKPDIVVCDSQVVDYMVKHTPKDINCTTFSILFSRNKGELNESVRTVKIIDDLKDKDKILIAEACSHHPIEDDIGRVKIPRWLREYTKKELIIESCAGRDYPDNLSDYKMVIHCGGCMITRREMLMRIQKAKEAGVGISNYGVVISYLHGTLTRVLTPFRESLSILQKGDTDETN
jgi:[FeFe] hydrogenase H-cluster maturation GTPase HydF